MEIFNCKFFLDGYYFNLECPQTIQRYLILQCNLSMNLPTFLNLSHHQAIVTNQTAKIIKFNQNFGTYSVLVKEKGDFYIEAIENFFNWSSSQTVNVTEGKF